MKIEIYTDGSCSLNNVDNSERECDGGFGYIVLVDGAPVYEYFDMYHSTTNNRMELRAIIHSLQYCLDTYGGSHEYIIYTDSAYISNCINQKWYKTWMSNGWKTSKRTAVKNVDLWKQLIHMGGNWVANGGVQFTKVAGHKNVTYNNRADELANMWRKSSSENFNTDKESPGGSFERVSTNQWLF